MVHERSESVTERLLLAAGLSVIADVHCVAGARRTHVAGRVLVGDAEERLTGDLLCVTANERGRHGSKDLG